jgi:hypothetical protein
MHEIGFEAPSNFWLWPKNWSSQFPEACVLGNRVEAVLSVNGVDLVSYTSAQMNTLRTEGFRGNSLMQLKRYMPDFPWGKTKTQLGIAETSILRFWVSRFLG